MRKARQLAADQQIRARDRVAKMRNYLQLAARVLVLLLVAPAMCHGQWAAAVQSDYAGPQREIVGQPQIPYLFPILRWGPNNQKRDLRHVLALAKELNAGVILTGVYKHYLDGPYKPNYPASAVPGQSPNPAFVINSSAGRRKLQQDVTGTRDALAAGALPAWERQMSEDPAGGSSSDASDIPTWQVKGGRALTPANKSCFSEPIPLYMPFSEVLDRAPLDDWVPTVTVAELKARGWDGSLEALVRPAPPLGTQWVGNKYVDRSLEAEGVTIAADAIKLDADDTLKCDPAKLQALREFVHKYRVVGLQPVLLGYEIDTDLSKEADGPDVNDTTKAACHTTLFKANHLLRPAPWIRELAQRYIHEITGFGDQPYLAIHVRPFPDECLARWRWGRFEPSKLAVFCAQPHKALHLRLSRCVLRTMLDQGVGRLFVMTHPGLRAPVGVMLSLGGLTDSVFLEASHVHRLAGCADTSSTFMAMVEEEISVQAAYFIGTSLSTITHTVAYQRMGLNDTNNAYFETMQC